MTEQQTPEDFAKALTRAAADFFKDKETLSYNEMRLIFEGTALFLFASGRSYQKLKRNYARTQTKL